ncbi:pilin [Candidatus Absconditicoccus praedator]|uniref:pilin n=1 Tax=Candidatus Absconditicoccus praedator TaxID=2735562 RepID=UPI001E5ACF08|nr:pilin [Candidatus Absconditicoccus praedator]UFX83510.1 hypothetical protein HLG78_05265 [Candidatus Absconditicoccus praedator]
MLKRIVVGIMMTMLGLMSFSGLANAQIESGFGDADETGGVGVAGAGEDQGEGFLDVVRNFVNWVLGIMALIALIILLWGGFLMVTAAGDEEKYNKGFKILKQAAIGLIMMGVAWFIVSIIFTVIDMAT